MAKWLERERWAEPWLLNFSLFGSRLRIGRWLLSARLFYPAAAAASYSWKWVMAG